MSDLDPSVYSSLARQAPGTVFRFPVAGEAGLFARVNAAADNVEYAAEIGAAPAPGEAGYRIRVNATGTGLEYVPAGVGADVGDALKILYPGVSEPSQRWDTTLTYIRYAQLSRTNAVNGDRFKIRRTGGGAYVLQVKDLGSGTLLRVLATDEWCEVEYDGSAWILTAAGSL